GAGGVGGGWVVIGRAGLVVGGGRVVLPPVGFFAVGIQHLGDAAAVQRLRASIDAAAPLGVPTLGCKPCHPDSLQKPAVQSCPIRRKIRAAMKITSIETCLLTIPTPRPISTEWPHHKFVVADIATDEGVRGQGYSMVFGGGGAEAVLAYLDARLKGLLIGEDPLQVERLWDKMYRGDRGVRRVGIAGMAISALDIALWDLAGKAAGLPLYKLWGGYTDRVSAYGSGGWGKYTEAELIAEAERYAAAGCRYYKMKIHHPDPKVNSARVAAVRKALPGMRMMVDVNQKLDLE